MSILFILPVAVIEMIGNKTDWLEGIKPEIVLCSEFMLEFIYACAGCYAIWYFTAR